METLDRLRGWAIYSATAALMGVVWYLALAVWPFTRQYLTESSWYNFHLHPAQLCLIVVTVSVGIALVFRRRIVGCQTIGRAALLAAVLPLAGTVLFTWMLVLAGHFSGQRGSRTLMLLVILPFYALLPIIPSFPAIFGLGALSQAVMRSIGRRVFASGIPAATAEE